MPSVDFARICRDMKDISESVHIHTSKNELTLECVGEFASCRMNIGGDPERGLLRGQGGGERALCAQVPQHLQQELQPEQLHVEVLLKKFYPAIFQYNVASLGYVRYCLAPVSEGPPPDAMKYSCRFTVCCKMRH